MQPKTIVKGKHEIVVSDHLLSPIEREKIERSLSRLSKLATLLDDQFELPVIKKRIGLDPIIGLIPGGGDWISWVISTYIIWEALRLKVPIRVLFGIGRNITTDFLVGYVPGIGDIIDVLLKANKRSVDLLLKHFNASVVSTENQSIILPENAHIKPTSSALIRYPLGVALVTFFAILAAIPLTLTYFLAQWWFAL